jgi:hypothetical protein
VHEHSVEAADLLAPVLLPLGANKFLQLAVRADEDQRRGRLEGDAALEPEDRVADVHAAADAVRPGAGVERLEQRHARQRLAVEGDRQAGLEADHQLLGLGLRGRGRDGHGVGVVGRQPPGVVRLLAADGRAEQALVQAVGHVLLGHGDAVLLEPVALLPPAPVELAHRREDREAGRERADGDVEADLVIAGAGAAVRDRVGAELLRDAHHRLGLRRALAADRDRVDAAAQHVALDQPGHVARPDVGARIHRAVPGDAQLPGPRGDGGQRLRREAAGVHRDRDHLGPELLAQPDRTEAGVEASGEGEDDGLHEVSRSRRRSAMRIRSAICGYYLRASRRHKGEPRILLGGSEAVQPLSPAAARSSGTRPRPR